MYIRFLTILLSGCVLLWSAGASADQSASGQGNADGLLHSFVSKVENARGQFTQVQLTEQGEPAGSAQTGAFSFQRPGKFKWHVQQPFEQLTLSDGQKLYQYDPDLAQLIVRNAGDSLGASPAAFLFGSGDLENTFETTALPNSKGLVWVRATPLEGDAGFSYMDIGFKSEMPAQLLITDSFGQLTRIELSGLSANVQLEASEFSFTAPPNTDIVNM